ncbi:MAG: DUF4238 domain-containing protein [Acidobacteria bacterium]|nr:DUF4238 domain-containing protein [Acidobacteriota bacterium]
MTSGAAAVKCEPRAHHFLPQCWLSGFTTTGENDGRLWVTDFKRRKQWPSGPGNAGHRRDFYRISDPALGDPVAFEKAFSRIESSIAPFLKVLNSHPRGLYRHEWESLFVYMAVQWMRVPAFRPMLLRISDEIHRQIFADVLKTPESWAAFLKKCGIAVDTPGAEYDRVVKFERNHDYSLSAEPEWFLDRGFKAIEHVASCLAERNWRAALSSSGSFICSDNPVAMDGPHGQLVGFKSADVVMFPVNRHVLVYGTTSVCENRSTTRKRIAAHNTFTMLTADEQVYSHVADFCWLDQTGAYQTDWKLFAKEKFSQRSFAGFEL